MKRFRVTLEYTLDVDAVDEDDALSNAVLTIINDGGADYAPYFETQEINKNGEPIFEEMLA